MYRSQTITVWVYALSSVGNTSVACWILEYRVTQFKQQINSEPLERLYAWNPVNIWPVLVSTHVVLKPNTKLACSTANLTFLMHQYKPCTQTTLTLSHSYNLRLTQTLFIFPLFSHAVAIWNHLLNSIVSLPNISEFKKLIFITCMATLSLKNISSSNIQTLIFKQCSVPFSSVGTCRGVSIIASTGCLWEYNIPSNCKNFLYQQVNQRSA